MAGRCLRTGRHGKKKAGGTDDSDNEDDGQEYRRNYNGLACPVEADIKSPFLAGVKYVERTRKKGKERSVKLRT